jgi:hypothetical protein
MITSDNKWDNKIMIKENPQEVKEWDIKEIISKSIIKLILNTYIINKSL